MKPHLLETVHHSGQSLRVMAAVLRECAIDPAPMLAKAEIDPRVLQDPQAEITGAQELRFQHLFVENTRHLPGLWMRTGLRYRLMSYGPLGLAVLAAANVTQGLHVTNAFQALTFSLMHYSVEENDGWAVALAAQDDNAPPALREFLQERALGSVTMFLNDMRPPRFPLQRIESVLDRALGWEGCDALLGVPVIFQAKTTRWVFEEGAGRSPLPMASPLLEETYYGLCSKLVAASPEHDAFVGRVSDVLVRSSRGFPTAGETAVRLGVSERTLHRRLEARSTSFGELLDRVRRDRAIELLERSTLPIGRIAEMLGFAETSSFTRAFRRWEGVSPLRHRKRTFDVAWPRPET